MMLNNFPEDLHPMTQFSAAIAALNKDSKFVQAYSKGVSKQDYWMVLLQTFDLCFFCVFINSIYMPIFSVTTVSTQCL